MLGNTLVVVNPAARSGKATQVAAQTASAFNRIKTATPSELPSYTFHYTVAAHEAIDFVKHEGERFHSVFAIGGDGIVNEVVNGLMAIPKERRPRLGLIPCGNGDDFARSIGMDRNPAKAIQQVESHTLTVKHIDVGKANDRWFAETLSFGIDAAIALRTHELRQSTKRTGTSLYVQCGIEQLRTNRKAHDVSMRLDGQAPQMISCYQLAVQNGMSYGGGFRVCPKARLNDGVLDICYTTPPLSFLSASKLFLQAKDGKHTDSEQIHFARAQKIELAFPAPLPAQIDGETFHGTKVCIQVLKGDLAVMMP